jgi:DNA-binding transcriptional regulator PaaX
LESGTLAEDYDRWLARADAAVKSLQQNTTDERAFIVRSYLHREWRHLTASKPSLPRGLLPDDWPGDAANPILPESIIFAFRRRSAFRGQTPERGSNQVTALGRTGSTTYPARKGPIEAPT